VCRAAALSPEIEWVESDMRTFSRPGTFDIAICLYTSFGFFDDDDDNRLVLQRVHENLRPGGRFVLDVMGKETLAKIYQPTGSTKLPGVGTAFTRRVPGVTNQWTLPTSPPATTTGP
jgi:SAM-dependent methyltransferase